MKTREIIRILEQDGWFLKGQKGSHMQFEHDKKPGKVTVPFHGSVDLPNYALASIYKQTGLKRRP